MGEFPTYLSPGLSPLFPLIGPFSPPLPQRTFFSFSLFFLSYSPYFYELLMPRPHTPLFPFSRVSRTPCRLLFHLAFPLVHWFLPKLPVRSDVPGRRTRRLRCGFGFSLCEFFLFFFTLLHHGVHFPARQLLCFLWTVIRPTPPYVVFCLPNSTLPRGLVSPVLNLFSPKEILVGSVACAVKFNPLRWAFVFFPL